MNFFLHFSLFNQRSYTTLFSLIHFFFFFLSGCGYRYEYEAAAPISVSIPYVIGDHEGKMTNALVFALSHSPCFRFTEGKGDWTLLVKVKESNNDRIGYRYDRDPLSGKLRDNVIGIENRRTLRVEVSVKDPYTGDLILGPETIQAFGDYDYVNPESLQDLSFIDPSNGKRTTSIAFSLGQLDSVGSAGEDVLSLIYQKIAKQIVEGMIASGGFDPK